MTHGHIRRVQQFALALAHEVGVTDPQQLEALEAAALLHDTGKLAIPEHILNKPGKLSAGEFETMKTHARVGAEILSSIKFPFPVVPIVRHHHENWDGTGYPDGLKSTDIPIGARILAVVDCFDALTSDRPYRRRMSVDDALQILFQRRGVMYDPLVVDTFADCLPKLLALDGGLLEPEAQAKGDAHEQTPRPVREPLPPAEQSPVGQDAWLQHALEAAANRTGAELALLFANDTENDSIVSIAAHGVELSPTQKIQMQLGHGVSGWVAVNGKPVVNADPALELRELPSNFSLVRTICVPIRRHGDIAGVLSLYSTDPRGFSDEDRAYLETFVAQLESERASLLLDPTKKGGHPPSPLSGPTIH